MNRAATAVPGRWVLAAIAMLLGVLIVWHVRRYSPGAAAIALGLLVPPWLLALPGVLRRSRRTLQMAAFLTTPYLVYGLTEVLANPGARAYAGMTVLAAFALFVALIHTLRSAAAGR